MQRGVTQWNGMRVHCLLDGVAAAAAEREPPLECLRREQDAIRRRRAAELAREPPLQRAPLTQLVRPEWGRGTPIYLRTRPRASRTPCCCCCCCCCCCRRARGGGCAHADRAPHTRSTVVAVTAYMTPPARDDASLACGLCKPPFTLHCIMFVLHDIACGLCMPQMYIASHYVTFTLRCVDST